MLDFVVDGDLADSPDTVVELEVFDQHWITDEEVRTLPSSWPCVMHGTHAAHTAAASRSVAGVVTQHDVNRSNATA